MLHILRFTESYRKSGMWGMLVSTDSIILRCVQKYRSQMCQIMKIQVQ